MAPKSVTFRRHDHLVSVLFGDLLSHSYIITFSMFLDLVKVGLGAEIGGIQEVLKHLALYQTYASLDVGTYILENLV